MSGLRIDVVAPDPREAEEVLRPHGFDVADSFLGRPATGAEICVSLQDEPSDQLAVFLVARGVDVVIGMQGPSPDVRA